MLEALDYAKVNDEPIIDDLKFPQEELDVFNDSINAIIEQGFQEIKCRKPIFGPLEFAPEASVREFVGPVLVAAARISEKVRIVSEKILLGKRGNGPVDYEMIYENFPIVITERWVFCI